MNVEIHSTHQSGKNAQKIKYAIIIIKNYRVNYGELIIAKKIALRIGYHLKN